MNGKRPSADELLSRAVSAMRLTPPPEQAMADALARTRAALAQANQGPDTPGRAVRIWRTIMRHKKLTLSAAAAMLIAVAAATLFLVPAVTPSVAFGQVMENMAKVKTLHARLIRKGEKAEIWAKRPNKVRMDLPDGTYMISNGPTMWRVDPKANKAVKSASSFYEDARRRGRDVVDVLLNMPLDDDFSGFFSEKPVARQKRDGKTYDVYRMEMNLDGEKLSSVGLVDVRTHLLHSISVERRSGEKREILFALTILSVDEPIPDGKFVFTPAKGMEVEVAKPRTQPAPAIAPAGRAVLSGRITWAASGKGVGGARIRLSTPPVQGRSPLVARITTDADGQWKATGVPAGRIQIDVRSWELNWPAVPTFKGNTGPAWRPEIVSDGRTARTGLDFKVYRPEEYYARVSVRVTDENGKAVAGAFCSLVGPSSDQHQSVLGPRHGQFTNADGRIASDFIWPTDEPVRLSTSDKDYPSPYAPWAALSEPFIVKSKGSYDLKVVLPFARKLKLTVLDRGGKPAAGLLVWASAGPEGWEALLLPQPGKKVTTANDGTALLDGLAPNAPAKVALLRLNPDTRSGLPPVASTVVSVTGPTENVTGEKTVTFDDRPIRIEGTVAAPGLRPDDPSATIRATAAAVPFWYARIAKCAFILQGLPAGEVRLRYRYAALPPAGRGTVEVECKDPLRLEPGHTYTVKITGDRVRVIGAKE